MATATPDDTLARIEARLDRMEAVLDRLSAVLDQTGAAIPMAFDTLDQEVGRAQARGVDVDARLAASLHALEKVTEPKTLEALARIAAQADKLETVAHLAAGFDDHTAMAFDIADDLAKRLAADGVDVEERLRASVVVLERATDPEVIATLDALLEHAPLAKAAAEYGHALPGYVAMGWDIFDEEQRRALERGFDLEEASAAWLRVMRQMGELTATPALQTLLDSPLLEPRTIELTAEIGEALAATLNEDPEPVGFFGALGALGDPKVQKAVGFLLAWARHIGSALEDSTALAKRR